MDFLQMMNFSPLGGMANGVTTNGGMALGGMNGLGLPNLGGSNQGLQGLLGNVMGGSFLNSGFSMQNNMTAMMQQFQQFFAQQQQQSQQAFSAWQANLNRATFQPDQSQTPVQQFRALQGFARENGSRDGTPVADWTDSKQDLASAQYLDELYGKQNDVVLQNTKNAPADQQAAMKAAELKLQEQVAAREAQGNPMSSRDQCVARERYIEKLYQAGQVGPEIGQANRDMTAIRECADQTWANAYLKNGMPTPAGMPQANIDRSPYNRNNTQAAAEAPQPAATEAPKNTPVMLA